MKKALSAMVMWVGLAFTAPVQAYTLDIASTTPDRVSGLWWNPGESGWGVNFVQQAGVIFVTMFTYDGGRNPTWYVASNCVVSGSGCSGGLYRVTGGSAPTGPWNGSVGVDTVGSISVSFSDINNGTMSYSINGAGGTKQITRQIFAGGTPPPPTNDRRAKTERLIGGTWSYTFTIISTYTDRMAFTTMSSANSDGDYLALGTSSFGDPVGGGYIQSLGNWLVVDPGSIIDQVYRFDFSDLNHVTGCYYQINPPTTGTLSRCYAMVGSRTPAKTFTFDLTPGARAELEAIKASEAGSQKAGVEDTAVLDAYRTLRAKLRR